MRVWCLVLAAVLAGCSATPKANECAGFKEPTAEEVQAHIDQFGCAPCPCTCSGGQVHCAPCQPCEPPQTQAMPTPADEWDPRTPIEDDIELRGMFVTTESASVCPTIEQAKANECGNSVESYEDGLRHKRGERLFVVGDAPIDGFWRSVRYTKLGRLPGWVDASRVATTPDLSHVEAFRRTHPDALVVTSDQLAVACEEPPPDDPDACYPLEPTVFLTRIAGEQTALVTGECFGVRGEHFLPFAWSHHNCLIYGDCGELDYVCQKDEYCDEVLFALEEQEPVEVQGKLVPAKRVTALADRVGVFADVKDCSR